MLAALGGRADHILEKLIIPKLDAESIIALGETCTQIRAVTFADSVAWLPAWKNLPIFLNLPLKTRADCAYEHDREVFSPRDEGDERRVQRFHVGVSNQFRVGRPAVESPVGRSGRRRDCFC